MKKSGIKTVVVFLIAALIILCFGQLRFLPWWLFTIPLFLLGAFISYKTWEVRSFWIGMIAGFIVWSLAMLYYDLQFESRILGKIADTMDISTSLLKVLTGCIGGLLSGLALYTGSSFFKKTTDKELKKLIEN